MCKQMEFKHIFVGICVLFSWTWNCLEGTIMTENISNIIPNAQVRFLVFDFNRLCPMTELCNVEINVEHEFLDGFSPSCCKVCECDTSKCLSTHTCCPDAIDIISYNYIRNDVTCVQGRYPPLETITEEEKDHYEMRSACLDDYNNLDVVKKCIDIGSNNNADNIFDIFDILPLFDPETLLTYRNKHCLECNHGAIQNIVPWRVILKCASLTPVISSLNQLEETIKEHGECFLLFKPPYDMSSFYNRSIVTCTKTIDTCNVTGRWTSYDSQIEGFCLSYRSTYKDYRNVHCAMCNGDLNVEQFCYPDILMHIGQFEAEIEIASLLGLENEELFSDEDSADKSLKHCAVVQCPTSMFLYRMKCRPFYTLANRHTFRLNMRLVLEEEVEYQKEYYDNLYEVVQQNIEEFKQAHFAYNIQWNINIRLNITADSLRSLSHLSDSETLRQPFVLFYEINIYIVNKREQINTEVFISSILDLYKMNFHSVINHTFHLEIFAMEDDMNREKRQALSIDLGTKMELNFDDNALNKIGLQGASFTLDSLANELLMFYESKSIALLIVDDIIFVSSFPFCPLLVISTEGYKYNNEKDGKVNATLCNETIKLDTNRLVFTKDSRKIYICIKNYLNIIEMRNNATDQIFPRITVDGDSSVSNLELIITIPVVSGVVLSLIVCLIVCNKKRQHNMSSAVSSIS